MSRRLSIVSPRRRAFSRGAAPLACAALALLACGPSDPAAEARALLEEGRLAEAIELLRPEIEARPGDPHLYLRDRTPSTFLKSASNWRSWASRYISPFRYATW